MDASTIWILIPIGGLVVGIVAIMAGHQQKMAEIIHGRAHKEAIEAELQALRDKVSALDAKVNVQALATHEAVQKSETVRQRLGT
jgi:hypothetical protein